MGKINWEVEKGNLGAEPEITYKKDNAMARLSIAVNRYRKDEDGEWEQVGITTWIRAVAFGYQAELIEAMELESGQAVYASGSMYANEYEDEDGDLVEGMNYYIDRLFPIPKAFEDEDDKPRKKKKKKKKKLKTKKGRKSKGKRKSKKSKGKSDVAANIMAQLKGK